MGYQRAVMAVHAQKGKMPEGWDDCLSRLSENFSTYVLKPNNEEVHVPIPDIALPHLYDGELIDRQGKGRPAEQGIEIMESVGAEEWWLCGAWGSGCVMRAAETVPDEFYVGVITDMLPRRQIMEYLRTVLYRSLWKRTLM